MSSPAIVLIYALVLGSAAWMFRHLLVRMKGDQVPSPPVIHLALVLFAYANWLTILIGFLLSRSRDIHWLGPNMLVMELFLLVLAGVAYDLRKTRSLSNYHRATFALGVAYLPVGMALILGISFGLMQT